LILHKVVAEILEWKSFFALQRHWKNWCSKSDFSSLGVLYDKNCFW